MIITMSTKLMQMVIHGEAETTNRFVLLKFIGYVFLQVIKNLPKPFEVVSNY
jgi:hypothetical protein